MPAATRRKSTSVGRPIHQLRMGSNGSSTSQITSGNSQAAYDFCSLLDIVYLLPAIPSV